jgi:Domain of unknown function (DUF4292)
MQKVIRGIVLFFALAGSASLIAQAPQPAMPQPPAQVTSPTAAAATSLTADQVVARYIDAIGGKEAIGQVKTITMTTSAQIMGNDAPGTTTIVDGVGYKNETSFGDSKIIQVYTAKGGWMVNPMAGMSEPTPMPDDQYKDGKSQIYVGGPLLDYAAKGNKIELLGSDKDTYTIKLTTKDNVESTYVIDATTFLLKSTVRTGKMQDQDVEVSSTYSDYKKTDTGYLVPTTIGVDFGGQFQIAIAVQKVETNKTIDPAIFDMPAAPAAPATPAPTAAPAAPKS